MKLMAGLSFEKKVKVEQEEACTSVSFLYLSVSFSWCSFSPSSASFRRVFEVMLEL